MHSPVWLWHRAPFLRYFTALAAGIVLQQEVEVPVQMLLLPLSLALAIIAAHRFLPLSLRYRLVLLNGLAIHAAMAACGALLLWRNDVRHRRGWIGNSPQSACFVVRLQEGLLMRARSWKTTASIELAGDGKEWREVTGSALLYFAPQPGIETISCGSRLLVRKPFQVVPDANNPGGFSYRRYCFFQGITHQAYLSPGDYTLIKEPPSFSLERKVEAVRQYVVGALRTAITGRREQGLAEALLIGYKDDLDKQLVQSYTRTGVVHIIAISGMHLALVYGLLSWLTRPLKRAPWLCLVLVIAGLWAFSLLAGGGASVVRATVMFSFVALGKTLDREVSIFNSLAASAFLLLCYQPYWLWDVGFQLSYAAVLSIVIFYTPIYALCSWTNPLLDAIWKSVCVSLAAQVLTTPLSLYHFHQFPLLFLLTNLVAVPLSSLVLMGEIGVCLLGWIPPLARVLGPCTTWLIRMMNTYIERLDRTSFAVWEGFSLSVGQTFFLVVFIAALYYWLVEKWKRGVLLALLSLLCFAALRTMDMIERLHQRQLIVYAAPHRALTSLVTGRDNHLLTDEQGVDENMERYCLQPARTLLRLRTQECAVLSTQLMLLGGKKIMVLRGKPPPWPPQPVDVLVVSGKMERTDRGSGSVLKSGFKPGPESKSGSRPESGLKFGPDLSIAQVLDRYVISCLVLDSSVPAGEARRWMKAANARSIRCHDVSQKGAFVMNL